MKKVFFIIRERDTCFQCFLSEPIHLISWFQKFSFFYHRQRKRNRFISHAFHLDLNNSLFIHVTWRKSNDFPRLLFDCPVFALYRFNLFQKLFSVNITTLAWKYVLKGYCIGNFRIMWKCHVSVHVCV